MRAHLARNVYRRVLIRGSHIPPCSIAWSPASTWLPLAAPIPRRVFRRTFFGIFQKAPREIKNPQYEPGWTVILTWHTRQRDNLRPPARAELVEAFQQLFVYKLRYDVTVNRTQAARCRALMRYLLDDVDGEGGKGLTLVELTAARDALLKMPAESTEDHLRFSRDLYDEIQKMRRSRMTEEEVAEWPKGSDATAIAVDDFKTYLIALTQYGGALAAVEALEGHWQRLPSTQRTKDGAKDLWVLLLRGLAKEGREKELLLQLKTAENTGVEYTPEVHEIMTTFYANRDNVNETKAWFSRPIRNNLPPTAETYSQILKFSIRNKLQDWSRDIFQQLCESNPAKPLWDIVFQWAVVAMGKGVDDVKHMIEVMGRHNVGDDSALPNIDTINGLIKVAMEKKDPYMAERFLSLATELGIQPDAKTFLLQIDYRIDARDLAGAEAAYEDLQRTEIRHDEDLPVINKYIRALCNANSPNFQQMQSIVAELDERIVTLEPETVSALCMAYLENDREFDVINTLSLHVFQYSVEQRRNVRDSFVKYCLKKDKSTARVWNAYSLLRQFFQETPVDDRTRLMNIFFTRKRPDMATQVFGHMRQHSNPEFRPKLDQYIRCFEGLWRCPDQESLQMVHNMLKMDTTVQPNTRLYNALMLAYAACDETNQALDYWKEITNSREGPSYASLEIVFWVLEKSPFGSRIARDTWKRMERMEVEVPRAVATAYVGALCGSGDIDGAKKVITGMFEGLGYRPDMMTFGVAYNALLGYTAKEEFKAWAKKEYPSQWAELEKMGTKTSKLGQELFKIRREMKT